MISNNAVESDRFKWLSFAGDGSDLSPFVREHFSSAIYDGKGFVDALREVVEEEFSEPPETWKTAAVSSQDKEKQKQIKSKMKEFYKKSLTEAWRTWNSPETIREGLRDVIFDLAENALNAWLSLEHYYLESLGYDQKRIFFFGSGGEEERPRFKGVDFSSLLRGQHVYRQEQSRGHSIFDIWKFGVGAIHSDSFRLFDAIEAEAGLAIETNRDLRGFDRALIYVARAAASDYQGLCLRNRADWIKKNLCNSFHPDSVQKEADRLLNETAKIS